uniref:Ataxin 2 SM domain-containing protein n=1 Tax=Gadus morhua TaxID=8049 RepID=A0A8C5FHN9_GADMO
MTRSKLETHTPTQHYARAGRPERLTKIQQATLAGGNRKPGGGSIGGATASSAGGSGGGRHNLGRGRHSGKGPSAAGTKCELKVKNGAVYEGVFKTYGPECDLVLDAAHRKSPEPAGGPRKEDIVESIIFKASDVVVVTFKDVDPNFARKVSSDADNFTDAAVSGRVNGEHKEKDLEPWDGGETHTSGSLESLDTDVSNGWDPNDMFKYNEEKYGVLSTYDSSLSTYTVPLERDNSEEFLKREAHALSRENKYIPPGQRNREALSWGAGRQNSPRLVQSSAGPPPPRPGAHDYSPSAGADQRVVNGGPPRMSPKSQRTPRAHRVPPCRTSAGVDFMSHNAPGEVPVTQQSRSSSSGGTWSSVVSGVHRPRSPRQNNMGGASPGPASVAAAQAGAAPMEASAPPPVASSPAAATPTPGTGAGPAAEGKESRVQETRQTSPTANKENIKPLDSTPSITRAVCKGPPSMAQDHRKQIDNLKKFSVDFRLQSSSNAEPAFDQMKPGDKPKDPPLDKASALGQEGGGDEGAAAAPGSAQGPPASAGKPGSPAVSAAAAASSSPAGADQKRPGPDVTSQGVQTTSPSTFTKAEGREEKKEAVHEQVKKSTLNPNAHEFKPRFNAQPKPANTPTPPRPQGQPSPSIVVQQPPAVYSQVCFPQMYPLTPVSPGVQKSIIWKSPAMYHIQMPHMAVSQSKPYRPVPNMPQQRSDQHHPPGTPNMMHPVTAAAPPLVAQNPAYSAQYFTCSPQQFASQPLVQQMPHYQAQAQHVFNPVMQGSARMMAPPTHGQPGMVSSSTTQYAEQTHTMYVSPGPMPQQYPHPNATLHPHPQHPQPSATPTGQGPQGGQHGGPPSHQAASPVQHSQHQQAAAAAAAAQALHMANQAPQQQMYSPLAPSNPAMNQGPNPQSPQATFPTGQQTLYLHPQQVPHGYNPNHMAHVQQAHMQSGMVQSHHGAPGHPPMMLMATQGPGGPQPQMPQNALNPIPVSSTTHFSYLAHPQVQAHHQQQL